MGVSIAKVDKGSLAERRGIRPGDILLRINQHGIEDVLDYRFYMLEPHLSVVFSRDGKKYILSLHKKEDEDIGLEFETYLMDKQHSCRNHCVFCFIDQLPAGLRESLYFKDDDSRMSFLFGNYITLTNLTEREIERIIAMHISPINISVHTTNPELRCRMMGNRFAGNFMPIIQRFADAGIHMECQLVICPGLNDGEELDRSMRDLAALVPAVESVAAVPVGLTRYRDGLSPLRMVTKEEAARIIRQMETFGGEMLQKHGMRVFYPADEFYLRAGLPIPDKEFYGDFSQLENGVGMMALLKSQFHDALAACGKSPKGSRLILATGTAAAPLIGSLVNEAKIQYKSLQAEVVPVINRFFGETITVAGLITGGDLIEQLRGKAGDILLIPDVMLRREGDLFLDDVSVGDVERELDLRVIPVTSEGSALLNALML